jgi:hypothetical protein
VLDCVLNHAELAHHFRNRLSCLKFLILLCAVFPPACVAQLHRHIDRDHIERHSVVVAAIRWSRQVQLDADGATAGRASYIPPGNMSSGHPALHAQFAATYWQGW